MKEKKEKKLFIVLKTVKDQDFVPYNKFKNMYHCIKN